MRPEDHRPRPRRCPPGTPRVRVRNSYILSRRLSQLPSVFMPLRSWHSLSSHASGSCCLGPITVEFLRGIDDGELNGTHSLYRLPPQHRSLSIPSRALCIGYGRGSHPRPTNRPAPAMSGVSSERAPTCRSPSPTGNRRRPSDSFPRDRYPFLTS